MSKPIQAGERINIKLSGNKKIEVHRVAGVLLSPIAERQQREDSFQLFSKVNFLKRAETDDTIVAVNKGYLSKWKRGSYTPKAALIRPHILFFRVEKWNC
ncbi:MAG: hypothetical protein B7Y39_00610 [Bdellovibrio sp. 28-41-41]|nr:MAG: hypothetical protein B7Y39_00610 [Bdellovibrio sp. 28-41-41]